MGLTVIASFLLSTIDVLSASTGGNEVLCSFQKIGHRVGEVWGLFADR